MIAADRTGAVSKLIIAVFLSVPCVAQDLTPRAYWPAPTGTEVLVLGFARAEGDVLFDPTVPLYNVDSELNMGIVAYAQTLDLAGRTSNLIVEVPYVWGETRGLVGDLPASRGFAGIADASVTLSMNLMGEPAMDGKEFLEFRADPKPILGASVKVIAPTGQYKKTRLINEGANRWAVKGELGYNFPLSSKWLAEFEAGVIYFGDDDDFLIGEKEQEPIYTGQAHLVRRFAPGYWASLNFNYFTGGRQTIGGNRLQDSQRNSKFGATVVFPVAQGHSIKVGYAIGWLTEFGADFDQLVISYTRVLQ